MLDQIKAHLLDSINDIVSSANQFVLHPEKDFSRQSQLTMKTMIQAILTMGGNTLAKELLDLDLPVSQSAFVQRRYQIKHQAFKTLFRDITSKIPISDNLPILAVDGSDVILPRNRFDKTTSFQTGLDTSHSLQSYSYQCSLSTILNKRYIMIYGSKIIERLMNVQLLLT